nr:MAG TPA: hypothetical protein [Caudoviricetes sp.]
MNNTPLRAVYISIPPFVYPYVFNEIIQMRIRRKTENNSQ